MAAGWSCLHAKSHHFNGIIQKRLGTRFKHDWTVIIRTCNRQEQKSIGLMFEYPIVFFSGAEPVPQLHDGMRLYHGVLVRSQRFVH